MEQITSVATNEAQSQNLLTRKLIGVELALQQSEQGVKILDLENQIFEQKIKEIIATACVAHGIKNLPSQEEKQMIFRIIRNTPKFRLLTIEQFGLAFEMNLTGEFESIKHFQLFSVEFMCAVLNSFLRRQYTFKAETKASVALIEYKPSEEDLKKIERKYLEAIINDFNKFCLNENCNIIDAAGKFLKLEKLSLINESNENKLLTLEQARLKFKAEIKSSTERRTDHIRELIKILDEGRMPKNENGEIKNIAREMTLRKWFAMWKEIGYDLNLELLVD